MQSHPAPPPPPPDLPPGTRELIRDAQAMARELERQGMGSQLGPSPSALTREQVASLRARRTELSNQLTSADGRRDELVEELANASGANRAGLEQRIGVLDQRIIQLESDLAATGRQLTASPTGLTGTTSSTGQPSVIDRLNPGDIVGLGATFIIVVLGPLAFAMARLVWRRAGAPPPRPAPADPADAQRLERIEQAVDAIALEVERVSEGQRFVTRVLADGRRAPDVPALGAGMGAAEPVRVPQGEPVPASRGRNSA